MSIKVKALTKSLWVFHLSGGSCNNCDIEILDLLTPRHDVERFGIVLVGSIRHADVLLLTGVVNRSCRPIIKKMYDQMQLKTATLLNTDEQIALYQLKKMFEKHELRQN